MNRLKEITLENTSRQNEGNETNSDTCHLCYGVIVSLRIVKYSIRLLKKINNKEKLRIVKTAAEIIHEDRQSYVCDSKCYPPGDAFLKNATSDIPSLLITFLQHLTKSKKKKTAEEETKRKCVAIAHSIVHIVRPRFFISSILDSLSLLLHRKYGSKNLINLLSTLGFCSPYHNAQLLEMSAIHQGQSETDGLFCQFVFDNADFNVSTIDGLNTFHAMGGIICATPASSLKKGKEIPKMKAIPPANSTDNFGVLPVEMFETKTCGLKDVVIDTFLDFPESIISPNACDTLWLCAQWCNIQGFPGWKGFMHIITKGMFSEKSKIIPVPFINSPPSNLDTVYTAIRFAVQYCEKIKQNIVILTFNQPLYMKCKEILATPSDDIQLSKCVVRLGGFHLLMSFLGCIGYLMGGSGLKELLCTIYAPLSVDKMLQGKAYSRAVRGHLLVQYVLAQMIFSEIDINDDEQKAVNELTKDFMDESPLMEAINNNLHLKTVAKKLFKKLMHLKQNGST